jgi:hypothetical protein
LDLKRLHNRLAASLRPVCSFYTANRQIGVRPVVVGLPYLARLYKTNAAVGKEKIPVSLPAPPAVIFSFCLKVIAVPLASYGFADFETEIDGVGAGTCLWQC